MRAQWALVHNGTAASGPFYYPSSNGVGFDDADRPNRKYVQLAGTGGVTFTVEHTAHEQKRGDGAVEVWDDVTLSCMNLKTMTTAASYVDTSAKLDVSHLTGRWRVKVALSDNTNDYRVAYVTGAGSALSSGNVTSAVTVAGVATEASLAKLLNCDHSENVTPGDATVVAYRVLVCTAAGTLSMKATSDGAATSVPMTAGQVLSCFNIVRVMAATTGSYVGGW